ncbi:hypothetical protein COCNU_scaffold018817G000020 [Cocos nucifera]|nr:hypothetical protein [Cocos nucifera]
MLKDPPLDQCLRQDLETLHSFVIPKLKELLSNQTLFNVGISQIVGINLSLPKMLGPTTLRKRKVESASEEEPMEVAKTSRIVPTRLKLEVSALEDYRLASKAFFNFLYLADTTKLLTEPLKIRRRKALDYFIWLTYYLNGFMECFIELLTEATKHKMIAKMLKVAKDKELKAVGEASIRVDAAERRAEDTKIALKKSAKENS